MSRRADVVHGTGGGPELCSDVGPAFNGGGVVASYWPLSDSLTLGALPTAVASARLHAQVVMVEWGLAGAAEDVALIVSELVTNAVQASTDTDGRPKYTDASSGLAAVHLRLWSDLARIVIEVWDQNALAPDANQPEPDAESGRGLLIVEALSERWGWQHVANWAGKVVWAQMQVVSTS